MDMWLCCCCEAPPTDFLFLFEKRTERHIFLFFGGIVHYMETVNQLFLCLCLLQCLREICRQQPIIAEDKFAAGLTSY